MNNSSNLYKVSFASVAIGVLIGWTASDESALIEELKRTLAEKDKALIEIQRQHAMSAKRFHVDAMSVAQTKLTESGENAAPDVEERVVNEQEQRAQHIERVAKARFGQKMDEYGSVLTQLGLPEGELEKMRSQLFEIDRRSLMSEFAIGDQLEAQNRFQTELRSQLGDEAFEEFREYERLKPVKREIDQFTQFYEENSEGQRPSLELLDWLETAVDEADVFTTESWDGPFGGSPQPTRGDAMVRAKYLAEIEDLEEKSTLLLELAQSNEFPANEISVMEAYYDNQIEERHGVLEILAIPPEERMAFIQSQQEAANNQ